MNKKVGCILIIALMIILRCLTAQAATSTADFSTDKESVKAGETFIVTLNINCADGINGVTGIHYSYEDSVLELVNSGVKDSNFVNIGDSTNIDLVCNSTSKITTSDIYSFTFKVKNNVENVDKAEISFSKFNVDSDAQTNSETEIEAKKVSINITSNEDGQDNKQDGQENQGNQGDQGNQGNPDGQGNQGGQGEQNNQGNKGNQGEQGGGQSNRKNQVNRSNKGSQTNSKNSIKELPKTGIAAGIGIALIIVAGIAVFNYIKYNRIYK